MCDSAATPSYHTLGPKSIPNRRTSHPGPAVRAQAHPQTPECLLRGSGVVCPGPPASSIGVRRRGGYSRCALRSSWQDCQLPPAATHSGVRPGSVPSGRAADLCAVTAAFRSVVATCASRVGTRSLSRCSGPAAGTRPLWNTGGHRCAGRSLDRRRRHPRKRSGMSRRQSRPPGSPPPRGPR